MLIPTPLTAPLMLCCLLLVLYGLARRRKKKERKTAVCTFGVGPLLPVRRLNSSLYPLWTLLLPGFFYATSYSYGFITRVYISAYWHTFSFYSREYNYRVWICYIVSNDFRRSLVFQEISGNKTGL